MSPSLLRGRIACLFLASASTLGALLFSEPANAEKVLVKGEDFEVFTDGRVAGFLSWVYGDGHPQPTRVVTADGVAYNLHDAVGGGFPSLIETKPIDDPRLAEGQAQAFEQGTINMVRLRSGFVSNVLGFGVRYPVTETTLVSTYIQFWAFVENEGRNKTAPNYVDARQGYGKVEGPWGSVIAGRTRALFSRGATDIDVQYAHKYGVGFPGSIESNGPSAGQLGFGPMGSGFASGIIYGTPKFVGLQLNAGVFDPIQLQGGAWTRTKYPRVEGELTYELTFGTDGKLVLFGNGLHQKVYKQGYCPPLSDTNRAPCDATAYGVGYGGRFEFGPARLGLAGHMGKGLGLKYALDTSPASVNLTTTELRDFDGYYAQTMFVFDPIDVFAGAGIVRVFLIDADKERVPSPADPTGQTLIIPQSLIKNQIGINGGVVYHATPALHFDLDYFRAEANWYLGEKQVLHTLNGGMTVTW